MRGSSYRNTRWVAVLARLAPLLAATWLLVSPAWATVVTCEPLGAPGVVINFCSNHGYYKRSTPIELRHASFGLSLLRDKLVAEQRIDDLPILVEVAAIPGSQPLAIARREACVIDYGEVEREPTPIGECYRLSIDRSPA